MMGLTDRTKDSEVRKHVFRKVCVHNRMNNQGTDVPCLENCDVKEKEC